MTRPTRAPVFGLTRLEQAVVAGLAPEVSPDVPDLVDQARSARVTIRRNSGFGHFTELLVDRPLRATAAHSRDLGDLAVRLPGLTDPVRFRARIRDGRLLGLLADSGYQDTRAIDFTATSFTLGDAPVQRRRDTPPKAVQPAVPTTPRPRFLPDVVPDIPVAIRLEAPPQAPVVDLTDPPQDAAGLRIGLYVLIAAGALIAIIVGVPFVVAALVAGAALVLTGGTRARQTLAQAQSRWQTTLEDQIRRAQAHARATTPPE